MVKVKLPFRSQRFTELTASQWQFMKELIDDNRKRKTCLRRIVNAILKITRTGCQWRNLDELAPGDTVAARDRVLASGAMRMPAHGLAPMTAAAPFVVTRPREFAAESDATNC